MCLHLGSSILHEVGRPALVVVFPVVVGERTGMQTRALN
jgi:hypothetical protein